jgi:hypothetical protein
MRATTQKQCTHLLQERQYLSWLRFPSSPLSPSPERIAEAFGEPLLEKEHKSSTKIRHAPWVARAGIQVVAANLTSVPAA